jgi:hypothetical protein
VAAAAWALGVVLALLLGLLLLPETASDVARTGPNVDGAARETETARADDDNDDNDDDDDDDDDDDVDDVDEDDVDESLVRSTSSAALGGDTARLATTSITSTPPSLEQLEQWPSLAASSSSSRHC